MTIKPLGLILSLAFLISQTHANLPNFASQTINNITVTVRELSSQECLKLSPYPFHESFIPPALYGNKETIFRPFVVVSYSIINNSSQDVILDLLSGPALKHEPLCFPTSTPNICILEDDYDDISEDDIDLATELFIELYVRDEYIFPAQAKQHLLDAVKKFSAVESLRVIKPQESFTTYLFFFGIIPNHLPLGATLFRTSQSNMQNYDLQSLWALSESHPSEFEEIRSTLESAERINFTLDLPISYQHRSIP